MCLATIRYQHPGFKVGYFEDELIYLRTQVKTLLLTSNRVFPYYQGDSTIFLKGNFLKHTPDSKNLFYFVVYWLVFNR